MTKQCAKCLTVASVDQFNRSGRARDGLQSYCKACQSRKRAAQYAANREAELAKNAAYHRANAERIAARQAVTRLLRYGLTPESFDAMLAQQGGRCAICRTDEPGGRHRRWVVDHDHSCCGWSAASRALCGRCNRGLLCSNCNVMLGMAGDSTVALHRAIRYLEDPPVPKQPTQLASE